MKLHQQRLPVLMLARLHKERLQMQTNELISCIVAFVAASMIKAFLQQETEL